MTTTTAPDVPQVTFPGQAATPAGPVQLLGMYVMHHAFRRDLTAFAAAAAATPLADRDTWQALDRRWGQFSRILHHHHRGEDTHLWPLLLAKVDAAGDAVGRETLEAMEAEHEEIDPLLASCADGFARMAADGDADARAALVVRVTAARERLGEHLAHEEGGAMPLLQAHLAPDEWAAMHDAFAEHYTTADMKFALSWLLHEVPPALRPQVHGFVGRTAVAVWRLLLRRGFERQERAAFRYA